MKARIRVLAMGFGATVSTVSLLVACSDDEARVRETAPAPDAGSDSVTDPPPPPAPEDEAGVDAGHPERPPFDPADEPVVCDAGAAECAVQIVAGKNHFCARMSDGTVRCWGEDAFGAIGEAPRTDGGAPPPVRTIGGLSGVTQISAAGATTCARLDDGTAKCWGDNRAGQLGLDGVRPTYDSAAHPVPTQVDLKEAVSRIDVGPRVVCAVLASGNVACWGENWQQQITQPSSSVSVPLEIDRGSFEIAKVSIGSQTTIALTPGGDVVSWGQLDVRNGVLGGRYASLSPNPELVAIAELHDVTSFAASATLERDQDGRLGTVPPPPAPPGGALPHAHACAIADGEVYCWGRSDFGALCTGLFDTERLPAHAPINGKAWPQQIAVGDELTCARMTDGSIQCCGVDHRGRLGVGFSTIFVPVEAFKGHAVQVATSHRAICALLQDGTVECWGSNQYGELGQGPPDQDSHPTPAKVAF